jgi:hypothetical protein
MRRHLRSGFGGTRGLSSRKLPGQSDSVDESLTPGQTAEYTVDALRAGSSVNVGLGASSPTLNESGRNADGSRSVNAGDSSQRLTRFASLQTASA